MPTKREQFVQTMRAQFLGERMRQLREDRGLTLKYIAAYLGVEFSTLARYERAEWPFRREHVIALLDVYGVYDEEQRTELIDLAKNAWRINQWQPTHSRHDTSGGGDGFVVDRWWLQSRAEELCIYAAMLVPDLVQTRDYAEAVIRPTEPAAMRVDKLVRQHLERQQALEDKKPPTRLTIILEEPVLYRPVGSRAVLVQQLEHLARLVERPHVNIRVLPSGVGWHHGMDGGFTVCRMLRPYPPAVLVEHLGGCLVVEADAADLYVKAFDRLTETALDPTQSEQLVIDAAGRTADFGLPIGAPGSARVGQEVAA